jgi:hypothetical protein
MSPEAFDTSSTAYDSPEPDRSSSEGRALVARSYQSPQRTGGYLSAPFLAQLVAIKDQHPQTRERRRAEPDIASAAYRAAAALTPD